MGPTLAKQQITMVSHNEVIFSVAIVGIHPPTLRVDKSKIKKFITNQLVVFDAAVRLSYIRPDRSRLCKISLLVINVLNSIA